MNSLLQPGPASAGPLAADVNARLKFIDPDECSPVVVISSAGQSFLGNYVDIDKPILDARGLTEEFTLDGAGFTRIDWRPPAVDFHRDSEIRGPFYRATAEAILEATGADRVVIFDHTLRRSATGGQRGPVQDVHADYTLEAALGRYHDLADADSTLPRRPARLM